MGIQGPLLEKLKIKLGRQDKYKWKGWASKQDVCNEPAGWYRQGVFQEMRGKRELSGLRSPPRRGGVWAEPKHRYIGFSKMGVGVGVGGERPGGGEASNPRRRHSVNKGGETRLHNADLDDEKIGWARVRDECTEDRGRAHTGKKGVFWVV